MKKLNAILLPCVFAFAIAARCADTTAAEKPETEDVLRFSNGDLLRCTVAGFDKATQRWQCVYASGPVLIRKTHLIDIQFHPREVPANALRATHDVLLTNGDLLSGVPVSLDDKSLLLDTWYAGKLTIPRAMIKTIVASGILYKGPVGLDGWVMHPDDRAIWTCKDGVLSGSADHTTIGRDMKLPSLARIEFDINAGNESQINVHICSDRVDKPGESYLFQMSFAPASATQSIGFGRYSPGKEIVLTGGLVLPMNSEAPRHHFDICINREAKTIYFYLDRNTVAQYARLDELPKMGGGLLFSTGFVHNEGAPMQISNLTVSRWSGGIDEALRSAASSDGDSIKASNRDVTSGALKSIADGMLVFTSPQGDLKIPFGQVDWIRMAPGGAGDVKPGADAMHFDLVDHGNVTMEIESWDGKQAAVSSPDFGKAIFSPDVFLHLQFDPGSPPAIPASSADGAGVGRDP